MSASYASSARILEFPTMPKLIDFVPTNRIRELRLARGLTLGKLAAQANTSIGQVARLETGQRELTQHWMQRLAKPLGCTPSDLMLPDDGGLDPRERELIEILREVPDNARAAIYSVAESQTPFRPSPLEDDLRKRG